jgi:hypothetical protein
VITEFNAMICLAHMLGWFTLGALAAVIGGRSGTLTISTSMAMGVISGSFHLVILYLIKHQ